MSPPYGSLVIVTAKFENSACAAPLINVNAVELFTTGHEHPTGTIAEKERVPTSASAAE